MKNFASLALLILLSQMSLSQSMTVHKSDQTAVTFQLSQIDSITFSSIPQGQYKIAFHSNRDGNWQIYSMNIDGSVPTRLTNDTSADQFPKWSPDGSKITFASNRSGHYQIYVMNRTAPIKRESLITLQMTVIQHGHQMGKKLFSIPIEPAIPKSS